MLKSRTSACFSAGTKLSGLQSRRTRSQRSLSTALDGPAQTQSDVFLVFSRTENPLVKTVFLRGQRKVTRNSSTDFTLLAIIVTIVAEQPDFDAQEAQYTTKTTTPVATEGDEENKQNSEFSLVYFLALFLSRFQCAIFQRSLRQRRDALKSLPRMRRRTFWNVITPRDQNHSRGFHGRANCSNDESCIVASHMVTAYAE